MSRTSSSDSSSSKQQQLQQHVSDNLGFGRWLMQSSQIYHQRMVDLFCVVPEFEHVVAGVLCYCHHQPCGVVVAAESSCFPIWTGSFPLVSPISKASVEAATFAATSSITIRVNTMARQTTNIWLSACCLCTSERLMQRMVHHHTMIFGGAFM